MSAIPVLKRILAYGAILAGVIALGGSIIGYYVAGFPGLTGALIGTLMAVFFLGITAASILFAGKFSLGAFFGIVMGAWLVKFVVFIILVLLLKDQPWLNPAVMFICVVVAVVGTLAVDVVLVARSRMPYVSDISLPTQAPPGGQHH